MSDIDEQSPACVGCKSQKQEVSKFHANREGAPWNELWTDGLICAFEFVRGHRWTSPDKSGSRTLSLQQKDNLNPKKQIPRSGLGDSSSQYLNKNSLLESTPLIDLNNTDSTLGLVEVPQLDNYKKKPKFMRIFSDSHWMPIGWARISELVQMVQPDASWASQPIDLTADEDDFTVADVAAPYWERPAGPTWWCHVTAGHPYVDAWLSNAPWLHPAISIALKDESRLISERMKHLLYEIIYLTCALWTCFRLFRKYIFGAADEIELKFVNRRNHEDLNLLTVILNQEIRRLATQVIRVKWSLHAREEIVFELLQHLRGNTARSMLEGIKKSTRQMLEEQEAVRGRLFTIQDVMQSTVRAWLQDRSLCVTHNLAVFGGGGLVLSIITSLFGINVDGIPGAKNTPLAFSLFTGILIFAGIVLIGLGLLYLGLETPITEDQVQVRKLELQQLVSTFQHDAETHAKVREHVSRHNLPPTAADMISERGNVLIR
uniref:Uncharacterized protein LOC105047222 n=1 Tax=Elaeis guineensis var. tenera TaxID=51953 RepID=A0A8N4F686_ELAGV|nr:uncharacterized protein LOC105047222 [Elaeis guineensis]